MRPLSGIRGLRAFRPPTNGTKKGHPPASHVHPALGGILCGIRLRCPNCQKGHISRRFFGEDHVCEVCGHDYEYREGEFTGAIIIAQFIFGLTVIPIFIALTVWTDWVFTTRAVVTVALATAGLVFFFRNIKGAWYGWLWAMEGGSDQR